MRMRVPAVLEKHEKEVLEKVTCHVCGKGTDEEVLLLCDSCGLGCHTFCLTPPLAGVPEHSWLCMGCMDHENIDSSEEEEDEEEGALEEPEQEGEDAALGTAANGLFRHLFAPAPDARCAACGAAAASRFVLDAAQVALPPRQTPPLRPRGRWLCEWCCLPAVEAAWNAQMAAAKEVATTPIVAVAAAAAVAAEEPPEKRRKRTRRFGPSRDLVLALAMERTGALERLHLQWRTIQKEYFPQCTARQLLRHYTSVQRRGAADSPLVQLFRRRAELRRRRREEEEEAAAETAHRASAMSDKTRERILALLRPLQAAAWAGVTCAGCARPVCGTLAWCETCGLNYCAPCHTLDPLGHALAHWSDCREPCSSCGADGVMGSGEEAERVVYCAACLDADALEAVAKQFLVKHKSPAPKEIRVLAKSLRISAAEAHAMIDRVRAEQ